VGQPEKKGRGPGRPFVKDDPRIRQNLEAAAQPLSEESEGMLAAMRHVVTKPPSRDTTYEQKEYRKWLNLDRKGFMTKKADLEKVALAGQGKGGAAPGDGQLATTPVEQDEASLRVEELIDRLLEKANAAAKGTSRSGN
jgi:hypothetical protein